jgi:hypothetical protein
MTITVATCYDNDSNYAFIGTAILSLSRRIMNRLFSLGEFVYSDTDSLLVPSTNTDLYTPFIGDGLGELKVEAQGDDVVVIRAKQYYLNENWARNKPKNTPVGGLLDWYIAKLG